MARKIRTAHLTESMLGQHLALSVAAHLARTQLVPDPLSVDDEHISEMLDAVGDALARVVPLYVQDPTTGLSRELGLTELEGAKVRRGATVVVLKDGRTLSSTFVKRADLRQAIAILKTVGVPALRMPPPGEEPAPAPKTPPLRAQLAELESLLTLPLIEPHVRKANALAVAIARGARHGRIANLAMQLTSALQDAEREGGRRRVGVAVRQLRSAVEELEPTGEPRGR